MSTLPPRHGFALRNARLVAALTLAGLAGGAQAAGSEIEQLKAQLRELAARFGQLEQRNQELEKKVTELGAAAPKAAPIEARVKALEEAQTATDQALLTDRLSENEPELVTRLKAVETQTLAMQKPVRQVEALEGITVEGGLVAVAQRVNGAGTESGKRESRLNYRGDIEFTLPGGDIGQAEGTIYAQLRFGQGDGVALRPTYTSTTNSSTFQVAGVNDPDSSFAVLAQAWYQLNVPLPFDGYKPYSRQRLEFTVGKMDPFVFFDQNATADDETAFFLNNAFVHNPLLDSGGDAGVDAYGFTPGVRAAYVDEQDKSGVWSASVAVFGSGPATNFSGSLGKPFVIGQLEYSTRLFDGLPGNYRVYAWRNGRAVNVLDDSEQAHSGWGLSIDQRVADGLTLFGRFGNRSSGTASFDRALTLGGELSGDAWGRAADGVGLAAGLLHTSSDYRRASTSSGNERVAELYYRYHVNEKIALTPDFQWISRPGGDDGAGDVKAFGLRATLGF
ncbi:carbohydrate porin [Rubrivivax gelatinosus]|uniref:carbohydrate porin n=1 Tax=Rubrivivax gelatinosus TaxID=28068 RepID=UPI001F5BFA76|nr:carbohydrate porin [Rubrivivax gelatinosus]